MRKHVYFGGAILQNKKISVQEIILLILMTVCFFATIIFLIKDNTNFALMTFCLHSILVIVLFFIYNEHISGESMDAEIVSTEEAANLADYLEEITRLDNENTSLRGELEKMSGDLNTLRAENEELSEQTKQAPSSVDANASVAKAYPMLLPSDETPVTLDLIESCKEVMDEMRIDCQKCGVSLQLSTDCDSLMVRADAAFIRIMLRNIIDNSVKYMKRNGSLVITVSHLGGDLFIVLKDNGEGLSSAETEHIFELNYQGSNRISGNGLGLTQAKAIVDYYGGTIYAKSGAGKGMAIYIQLPSERE